MEKLRVALQLWSLRDALASDFIGSLRAVAAMGYDGVEFAGYGGLQSGELKRVLDDLGLAVVGSHVSWQDLEDDLERVLDYNTAIGNGYIVCPGAPGELTQDALGWSRFANSMSDVAEKAGARGIKVGYHNHDWEFQKYDGIYGLDIFYEHADGVFAELDLGWIFHAGVDPVEYMRGLAGRVLLIHIKDFLTGGPQTEVGTGDLPLAAILEAAPRCGVKWHIVEIEEYNMAPIESVRVSLVNIKKLMN